MECKLKWNFQRGGGRGLRNNPFHGGGMDNLRNYTFIYFNTTQAMYSCISGKPYGTC